MRKIFIGILGFAATLCAEDASHVDAPMPMPPSEEVTDKCATLCVPCQEFLKANSLTPENKEVFCHMTKAQRTEVIRKTNQDKIDANEAVKEVAAQDVKRPKGCPVK